MHRPWPARPSESLPHRTPTWPLVLLVWTSQKRTGTVPRMKPAASRDHRNRIGRDRPRADAASASNDINQSPVEKPPGPGCFVKNSSTRRHSLNTASPAIYYSTSRSLTATDNIAACPRGDQQPPSDRHCSRRSPPGRRQGPVTVPPVSRPASGGPGLDNVKSPSQILRALAGGEASARAPGRLLHGARDRKFHLPCRESRRASSDSLPGAVTDDQDIHRPSTAQSRYDANVDITASRVLTPATTSAPLSAEYRFQPTCVRGQTWRLAPFTPHSSFAPERRTSTPSAPW